MSSRIFLQACVLSPKKIRWCPFSEISNCLLRKTVNNKCRFCLACENKARERSLQCRAVGCVQTAACSPLKDLFSLSTMFLFLQKCQDVLLHSFAVPLISISHFTSWTFPKRSRNNSKWPVYISSLMAAAHCKRNEQSEREGGFTNKVKVPCTTCRYQFLWKDVKGALKATIKMMKKKDFWMH